MMIVAKKRGLRWGVFISVLLNIVANFLSVKGHLTGTTIEEVTQHYENSFTPADFTFSIWSIIYLSYMVYAVYQLLPSKAGNIIYSKVAIPFIAVNLLSILWIVLFSFGLIGLSLLIIATMLVIGFLQFNTISQAIEQHRCRKWVSICFSLFFSWISVATLANFSSWFVAITGRSLPPMFAILMLCLILAAAIFITVRYRDWVYPLVISWACIGIWSTNRVFNPDIASLAIGASFLLIAWTAVYLIIQYSRPPRLEY
jgi:benzodiazapine receptor